MLVPDEGDAVWDAEASAPTAFDGTIRQLLSGTLADADKYTQDVQCPACHHRATVRCSVPFDVQWERTDHGAYGWLVGTSTDPISEFWMTLDGRLAEWWQKAVPPEVIYGVPQGSVHSCIDRDHGGRELAAP